MNVAGAVAPAAQAGGTAHPRTPLVARGVGKSYGEDDGELNQVIGDISFSLRAGEIVRPGGPIWLWQDHAAEPDERSYAADTWLGAVARPQALQDVPKGIGYMLQKDMLMPWRNVLANVTLGLELTGMPRAHREKKAHAMLGKVGLGPYYNYYPSALSGGMRARVALARTLVTDPEVMLLDEPFAALDFQRTKLVLESDMARLVRGQGRSVLLITHDVEEAVSIVGPCDRPHHTVPSHIKAIHEIHLDCDRNDMMAARDAAGFTAHVREIWSQLDVRMGER